eukprot:scaffold1813_cov109-Cylindrotheca_fusiformis.AAC.9
MEPALDVLDRSLHGDAGARSFLDRTSSIYVMDATDMSKPKTYGCWNFIHQAINEIERAEATLSSANTLSPHVQLLANMALRVARRSNDLDKYLVATCIENASKYHGSASDSQKLIDINVEIRDIVMGRIAALALDPNFHGHGSMSSFADTAVLEMLCAVLAANAVSNGPAAVHHLLSEWILPSAVNLPPYCLACVTLHLAFEASRKSAPAGTQDMLQQVSRAVMSEVLAPVLSDSIKESKSNIHETNSFLGYHERNCRVAALSLRAVNQWCAATDLSLAQIKHINIVDVLSDAMYSDSGLVVDALAELIEAVMTRHQVPTVSDERMTQVRYIMQVDELSFRSSITKDQLVTIETKEMVDILEELVLAIGLQRFRFIDRQNKGDDDVCRNLTRIGCSICLACTAVPPEGRRIPTSPGLLDLLMKSASHQSVNICGMAIDVLRGLASSENGLHSQILPVLQRRAITPHHAEHQVFSLEATDICGVNYHEFENFRDTVLRDALIMCLQGDEKQYMASCTAAIEEFCTGSSSTKESFHLEAALFCMSAVAEKAMLASHCRAALKCCIIALAKRPESLMGNALCLAQANTFLRKYAKVLGSMQDSHLFQLAADLALSTFNLCASEFPSKPSVIAMKQEANISPYACAAEALQEILSASPESFASNEALAAIGARANVFCKAGWEASYTGANTRDILATEDRKSIGIGICHVLASLPESQRSKSLLALAMPSLDCLETMVQHATHLENGSWDQLDSVLDRIGAEIAIVATMASSFSRACAGSNSTLVSLHELAVPIVKRAWPSISHAASKYNFNEVCLETCPFFLLSLTASPGEDRRGDLLIRRAVEASVSCILESDAETSNSAMALLEATVNLAQSVAVEEIRHVVEDMLSRALSDILTSLVVGGCGKLNSTSLDNAARFLRCILMTSRSLEEIKSNLVHAIGNDNVFLGVRGKEVTLEFLLRSYRNENSDADVSDLFHDLWELHQIETPEALPNSDAVVHFCKKYAVR